MQAALALAQATLWWAFVPWFGERVVRRYVDRAPWGAQWYELNRATRKYLSPPETDKVAREMCGILLQHQIGALLVVPAMVGALQPELASALALHGALCEVGMELQDAVVRIYDVLFFGEEGKMRQAA